MAIGGLISIRLLTELPHHNTIQKSVDVSAYFSSYFMYQGTAAGGTMEIVVNGTTGWLHPTGKEGVTSLAENIVKLATDVDARLRMGKKGYERVKETFLEQHMSSRIALVLKEVLQKAKNYA